jgi:hypothetical protein
MTTRTGLVVLDNRLGESLRENWCQTEGHIHLCDIWGNGRKGRHNAVNHKRVDETQPMGPPTKVFISCSEDWSDECASGVAV